MARFDPSPKSDTEVRDLIYECQKTALAENIQFTYSDDRVDGQGELISEEISMMDTIQMMNFRDLDSRQDRVEYINYIRFLDKECYLSVTGYHDKLHRLDHVFKSKKDDRVVDIDVWRKLMNKNGK